MVNILIVDDSETEIAILKTIFAMTSDFKIVGIAKNGEEAINLVKKLKPDIITMDIAMPLMNGIEATRVIMAEQPTPIVVISSKLNDESLNATFRALEAGALSVLDKPQNITLPTSYKQHQMMIDTLRSMSEIKVIKRRFHVDSDQTKIIKKSVYPSGIYDIIGIGASVGGPKALNTILSKLPADFPVPIVIVQHMTIGFVAGFTKWLNQHSALTVKNAEDEEELKRGVVYMAGDGLHLEVHRKNSKLIAKLIEGKPISGFCPSVSVLFRSIAKACGKNAIGVLLTGMGNDGAEGLLDLKLAHSHTLVQDPQSAIVFGMGGVAQSLGAVDRVIPLDEIADYLLKKAKKPALSI